MILNLDCRHGLAMLPDNSVDAIVTDPPYEIGMMGRAWDRSGIAHDVAMWREALRVLKPGGHMLAFSGSRTYHRMAVAIEDAGFEIRDQIMWVYGSGYPKHRSSLKPAHEPIVLARKPAPRATLLNIDACRVEGVAQAFGNGRGFKPGSDLSGTDRGRWEPTAEGRYPANLILTYDEDSYMLRDDITLSQRQELEDWLNENT